MPGSKESSGNITTRCLKAAELEIPELKEDAKTLGLNVAEFKQRVVIFPELPGPRHKSPPRRLFWRGYAWARGIP